MKLFRLYQLFALGATMLLFPACDGILDGIYDQPPHHYPATDSTRTATEREHSSLMPPIYAQWTYINLHTEEIDSTPHHRNGRQTEVPMGENASLPAEWDFANPPLRCKDQRRCCIGDRGDQPGCRTTDEQHPHGELRERHRDPNHHRYVGYDGGQHPVCHLQLQRRACPNGWTWTPARCHLFIPYLIRCTSCAWPTATYAALRLTAFRNEQNTSGHLTIEYAYPL